MNQELKPGQRVRLTRAHAERACQTGDTGTVLHGPYKQARGEGYYVVRMDKDGSLFAAFLPDDIEVVDQ